MCTICGCGMENAEPEARHVGHRHVGGEPADPGHEHGEDGALHFGRGPARAQGAARILRLERDILSRNAAYARQNRERLMAAGQFALNMVSSPGSGKTALLVRAIGDLRTRFPIAVIEGDQQTSNDADRIRATGAPAIQINTGKGCHLDAHMVGHAIDALPPQPGGLLFIENVGNLVCPAAFDLGEAARAVVLSVTEGEDKPLKYADMFAGSGLMLINKADLLPHVDFDVAACTAFARRINPAIDIFLVSARTGAGMSAFYDWLAARAGRLSVTE